MKILSLLEIKKQYGTVALDAFGYPVTDEYGETQTVLFNHVSNSGLVKGSVEENINMISANKQSIVASERAKMHRSGITDDTWAQFTYEEIINMHNNGTDVPADVLKQAYDMMNNANEDTVADATTSEENTNTEQSGNAASSTEDPYLAYKKNATQALATCKEKNEDVKKSMEDMDSLETELNRIQKETEEKQLNSLQEMQQAAQDWKKLKSKADGGETLTDSEQSRLKELGKVFNDANNNFEETLNKDISSMQKISTELVDKTKLVDEDFAAGQKALDVSATFQSFDIHSTATWQGFAKAFSTKTTTNTTTTTTGTTTTSSLPDFRFEYKERNIDLTSVFNQRWSLFSPSEIIETVSKLNDEVQQTGYETQSYSKTNKEDIFNVANIMNIDVTTGDITDGTDAMKAASSEAKSDGKGAAQTSTTSDNTGSGAETATTSNTTTDNNQSGTTVAVATSKDTATTSPTTDNTTATTTETSGTTDSTTGTTGTTDTTTAGATTTTGASTTEASSSQAQAAQQEQEQPTELQKLSDNVRAGSDLTKAVKTEGNESEKEGKQALKEMKEFDEQSKKVDEQVKAADEKSADTEKETETLQTQNETATEASAQAVETPASATVTTTATESTDASAEAKPTNNATTDKTNTNVAANNDKVAENNKSLNELSASADAETAAINASIASVDTTGMKAEEKYKKALDKNSQYDKSLSPSNKIMEQTGVKGAGAIIYGALQIYKGTNSIADGVSMLSSINVVSVALAYHLIKTGVLEVKTGIDYDLVGAQLVGVSLGGFVAVGKTDKQIGTSDKNLNKALDKVKSEKGKNSEKDNTGATTTTTGTVTGAAAAMKGAVAQSVSKDKKSTTETNSGSGINAGNGKQAAGDVKNQAGSAQGQTSQVVSNTENTNKCAKQAEKTSKTTKNREKALKKQIAADQKLLQKNEDAVNKLSEQIDVDATQIQNLQMQADAEAANQQNQAQAQAMLQSNSKKKSSATPQANASVSSSSSQIQAEINEKSTNITSVAAQLSAKSTVSSSVIRRMDKTNKQYTKEVQKTKKNIQSDQQEQSKVVKFADKVEKICSPIATTGLIVKMTGQVLSKVVLPPWVSVVGAVMIPIGAAAEAVGNYGVAAANVAKTAYYAATGNLKGALVSAGMAIMSGVAAVGATKAATAGLKNLSTTIAASQERAVMAKAAKEAAKNAVKEGVDKGSVKAAEQISKNEGQNIIKEGVKQASEGATSETIQETAKKSTETFVKASGQAVAKTATTDAAKQAMGKVVGTSFAEGMLDQSVKEIVKDSVGNTTVSLLNAATQVAGSFVQDKGKAEDTKKVKSFYNMSEDARKIIAKKQRRVNALKNSSYVS